MRMRRRHDSIFLIQQKNKKNLSVFACDSCSTTHTVSAESVKSVLLLFFVAAIFAFRLSSVPQRIFIELL